MTRARCPTSARPAPTNTCAPPAVRGAALCPFPELKHRCGAVPDACGQHPDGRSLGPVLGAQRARRGLLPALRYRLNPPLTSGPQPTQRDERGFCVLCTAKRLPETMVLASYLLPAEPAILHDVAAKKVLQLLEPLIAAQKGAS